ncbi:MAG: prolipoprotein diacylglyceryl transferase [Rhodothermia bacterium]|nr:MAG: prolipoprotein diacylglyceryl transferase [Rhodothermia bacterium]
MTDATPFVWNVDRVLIELGPFSIKWYGLLFATGFLIGYEIIRRIYVLEEKPEEDLGRLLVYMLVATVVGARLGEVVFYNPDYYFSHPFEILKVWKGGLASHGGGIGIGIGLYLYSRSRDAQPYLWLLDRIAIPTALAGALIRLGNFFNSEIIGDPTDVPWAVVFSRVDSLPRHPAQLYESVAYVLIFAVLYSIYRRRGRSVPDGLLLGLFFLMVFSARFFIEYVKAQQAAYILPVPLSVGQLLSIPAILLGIGLLIYSSSIKRGDGIR